MNNKIKKLLKKISINKKKNLRSINYLIKKKGVKIIDFLNTHAVNLSFNNVGLYKYFINCDLLLRDGLGIKIALIINRYTSGANMNGTDLIPKILNRYKDKKIVIFGSKNNVIHNFHEIYKSRFKDLKIFNGYQKFDFYLKIVKKEKPNILLIAMGMPKQEHLSEYLKKKYSKKLLIINGGAILDFMSKEIPRAPYFVKNFGFEWLFRLLLEPKRLFRRYVFGNPIFIFRVLKERFLK
jgi:exopolysaccharide biosynthesis WecB/TagA/CpsF family protein